MDRSRRYVVTGGMGAATLNPGGSQIQTELPESLDFKRSLSAQASFGRRLAGPTPHITLFAEVAGTIVAGAGLRGAEAPSSCDVHWQSAGPVLALHFATPSPTSFEVRGGMSVVHASRSCERGEVSGGGESATTASPMVGGSILFGLTPGVGWGFAGQWLQVPLDRLGLQTSRHWGGVGAVSVVITFPRPTGTTRTASVR